MKSYARRYVLLLIALLFSIPAYAGGDSALFGKVLAPSLRHVDLTQVKVTLENTGAVTSVDQTGRFRFDDLDPGVYAVSATLYGDPVLYARKEKLRLWNGLTRNTGTLILREGGSLSGFAFLDDSNDHSGIQISIQDTPFTTSTAADGSYNFPSLPPGEFTLLGEMSGYESASAEGVLVELDVENLAPDMVLTPVAEAPSEGGSLSGIVYGLVDGVKSPLKGASVSLTSPYGGPALPGLSASSDANGHYKIVGPPGGFYQLHAKATGFRENVSPIVVIPLVDMSKNVVLNP